MHKLPGKGVPGKIEQNKAKHIISYLHLLKNRSYMVWSEVVGLGSIRSVIPSSVYPINLSFISIILLRELILFERKVIGSGGKKNTQVETLSFSSQTFPQSLEHEEIMKNKEI